MRYEEQGREFEPAELMVGGAYLGALLTLVVFLGMLV